MPDSDYYRPHVGLGPIRKLEGDLECAIGRWPSLLVDTGGATVQIDLDSTLSAVEAEGVVHQLARAVMEWEVVIHRDGTAEGE